MRSDDGAPSGVERGAEVRLPTRWGDFRIQAFGDDSHPLEGDAHVALTMGDIDGQEALLVRVHSECLTGDIFGSKRCDCGEQLHQAMARISEAGRGAILYLRQEGRGIGLANKLRAYALQERGEDTVEANLKLGFEADLRSYGVAARYLLSRGVRSVRLMTNNPAKVEGLESAGVRVVERLSVEVKPNEVNRGYLETKRDAMRHLVLRDGDES